MINQGLNLLLNELKWRAGHRNISDYQNKSGKKMIKARRGSRPGLRIKKNNLKEIKEDFRNLRHAFSKKDAGKYRKLVYYMKSYRNLSEPEI